MVFDSSKGHHIQLHTKLHLCPLPTWFWGWPPLKIRELCSVKTWDFVFTKTNQKLWFISRFTWVVQNPQALQKCFCSQVRQLLEYDCCINKMCTPYTLPHDNKIAICPEKVFVFGEHMSYYPLLKVQLEKVKDLIFLSNTKSVDFIKLAKQLNGHIGYCEILEMNLCALVWTTY